MSLVAGVLVAAGGVALGRWLGLKLRPARPSDVKVDSDSDEGGKPPSARILERFPCQLGDVVVRTAERDEAWLAGVLVFEEAQAVAALFVAPEARADRAVFVREAEARLTWLTPLASGALELPDDPPSAIEHEGMRFERVLRLPVRVTRLGTGAPTVGPRAVVAEYAGPGGEQLLVVAGSEQTLAWEGVALAQRDYDVLPGSAATLE